MNLRRSVLLAALVAGLLGATGCVTTRVKMIGPKEPPLSPDQVDLYGSFPRRFHEVALVEAQIYFPMFLSAQAITDMAVGGLTEAAAEVGADGLMIRNLHPASMSPFGYGHRAFRMGTTENSFAHMTTMHAVAISTR